MNSEELVTDLRARLLEGNACPIPSVTSKLPFPYHWIPGDLRMLIARALFSRYLTRLRKEHRSPRTYADNRSDSLANQSMRGAASSGSIWEWPEGRACAIVLSHDVDTPGQTAGIERLRKVAEKHGMCSTFSFVGSDLGHYDPLIRDLKAAGHEIALHDRFHDNRIAFLTEAQIFERLGKLRDSLEAYGIRGFRSPSWYTSTRLWNALRKLGFRYDMSVLDSWSFFDATKNYGVGTLFPYRVDGLAILPNTIPFDDMPRFCGYAVSDIFSFWKPKFDWIARNEGLIMLNAHPDRWWSGNSAGAAVFDRSIGYVLETYDPARLNAGGVAGHLDTQAARGAFIPFGDKPKLEIPLRRVLAEEFPEAKHNPILTDPRKFLVQRGGAGE